MYIGINHNIAILSENALRQALSSGIDRAAVCRESYYNNAIPANGFYNPVWQEVQSIQNIETTVNREITIANLEKIGYNNLDSDGVRICASGGGLRFTLLVNAENNMRVAAAKLIANQLAEFGIKLQVKQMKYDAYTAALKSGNFQLYLAETAIPPNMDLSELILPGGSAAYGVKNIKENQSNKNADALQSDKDTLQNEQNSEPIIESAVKLINGFYEGGNTIVDIAVALQDEMPFIPICYRTGVLFYNDKIENVENSSASDIYFSIGSYIMKQ